MREQILAFHFTDKERLRVLRKVAMMLRIRCKVIDDADAVKPVGTFVGLETTPVAEAPCAELTDEVMLLCGLSDSQLQYLLGMLRQVGLFVPYKAMLTPTNKDWSAGQLFYELHEEHMAIEAYKKEMAAKAAAEAAAAEETDPVEEIREESRVEVSVETVEEDGAVVEETVEVSVEESVEVVLEETAEEDEAPEENDAESSEETSEEAPEEKPAEVTEK